MMVLDFLQKFSIFWTVFAMDFLDSSSMSQAKLPRFHEIKEIYSEELESSVIFPDSFMRAAGSRGRCYSHMNNFLMSPVIRPLSFECYWFERF